MSGFASARKSAAATAQTQGSHFTDKTMRGGGQLIGIADRYCGMGIGGIASLLID